MYEWERHPVTVAYLRLLQAEFYNGLRAARNDYELQYAHGIEHAISLQETVRDSILKDEEGEEDGEGNNSR